MPSFTHPHAAPLFRLLFKTTINAHNLFTGKKAQIAGYYYTDELQMTLPYRIYNTWMGDPAKLLMFDKVIDVVEKEGLLESTRIAGAALLAGLTGLVASARIHPEQPFPYNCARAIVRVRVRVHAGASGRAAPLFNASSRAWLWFSAP